MINLEKVLNLKCVKCGAEYTENEAQYVCPRCGIDGILDVIYNYELIGKEFTKEYLFSNGNRSINRYFPILPVERIDSFEPLQVGNTPLYEVKTLRKQLELDNLYIKDDSRNPTLSFKDRASAIGIAKAKELKRNIITAASTGNAASSISGFAASAGIESIIFVPKTAPEAKIMQLLIFGSTVFLVDGTYDEAFELCFKAAEKFGWYNRSCAVNPYLVEGKKTVAFEIIEQLDFMVPDYVVMSVGDGCSISSAYKGFVEFRRLGLTNKIPKMIGIQATDSNPVTRAYNNNTYEFEYREPKTVADSISVGIPRNGIKALNAIIESGGYMIDVSDKEIIETIKYLASNSGIFGEPAGATGFAGVRKLKSLGLINKEDLIVTVVTGSGLKDLKTAQMSAPKAHNVSTDINELVELMEKVKQK